MIRVFITDDHVMVREGLKVLIDCAPDLKVCGEAETAEEALTKLEKADAEILLLDVRLPEMSGLEACPIFRQKYPELKIIILTSFMEPGMALQAMQSGAKGYLLKEIDTKQLCESIRQVHAGQLAMPSGVAEDMLTTIHQNMEVSEQRKKVSLLSKQETEVANLVSQGLMNKEIADQLGLSEKTVKNYMTNIFSKLAISRRSQLAVFYAQYIKAQEDSE